MGLQFAVEGRIPVKQFITKVLPFEKATEAWETTRRGEGIKALIEVSSEAEIHESLSIQV
jgi:D-xylulose reductase